MIRLDVPAVVQNGTEDYVILDCVYSFNESEKAGMVLTWYFNQSMVYQWIPPRRPNALGMLQNRLDLNYTASEDPYKSSRALKIIHPSIEMMGEYSCKVSTFISEASKSAQMLIYGKNLFSSVNNKNIILFSRLILHLLFSFDTCVENVTLSFLCSTRERHEHCSTAVWKAWNSQCHLLGCWHFPSANHVIALRGRRE